MKKILKIIFFTILFILACIPILILAAMKYNPIAHINCLKNGDTYTKVLGPPGVFTKYYCIHAYKDAGKKCKSSNECEGDCLNSYDYLQTQQKKEFGVCEESNAPIMGCYPGTFDDTKIAFCF